LRKLSWNNFTLGLDDEGNEAYIFKGSVGGVDGTCKNTTGGIKAAKDVPTNFMIFDEELAFGINRFKVIKNHALECANVANKKKYFFLSRNHYTRNGCLLKDSPIGENNFSVYFNDVITACEIKGQGFNDKPTLHSLRGTLISKLQRMGHTETQIQKRTGHRSTSSLSSYTTCLGEEGRSQQQHILSQDGVPKNPKQEGSSSSNPPKSTETPDEIMSILKNVNAQNITIDYYSKKE